MPDNTQNQETPAVSENKFQNALEWSRKHLGNIDRHPFTARLMVVVTGLLFYWGSTLFMHKWLVLDFNVVEEMFAHNIWWVAIFLVALNLWETVSRNDLMDFGIVILSVAVTLFGLWTGDWVIIAITFIGGIEMVHYACHSGELDWSPMVGFTSLFVAAAVFFFGGGAISIFVPVFLAMVFEVVEVIRTRNYQSIRIFAPGFIFSALAMFIFSSVNPLWFAVPGVLLSLVVIPTAIQVFDKENKLGKDMLNFTSKPLSCFTNSLKNLTVDLEAASLTSVFIMALMFLIVMI